MQQHLINNNSKTLLIFFTGWGCDEYEFVHLKADSDVLILFDYTDLELNFDFSKYKNFNLIAFSAGVFVASIFDFDFKIDKRIAISGNPYLFDEYLGLSNEIQNVLYNITEESAEDFARNYLVKTDDEWKNFHNSKRSLESCKNEFQCLKKIYQIKKQKIKDNYNVALMGDGDPFFVPSSQKEFYGKRLNIVKNARHNLFFRINTYEQLLNLSI